MLLHLRNYYTDKISIVSATPDLKVPVIAFNFTTVPKTSPVMTDVDQLQTGDVLQTMDFSINQILRDKWVITKIEVE